MKPWLITCVSGRVFIVYATDGQRASLSFALMRTGEKIANWRLDTSQEFHDNRGLIDKKPGEK